MRYPWRRINTEQLMQAFEELQRKCQEDPLRTTRSHAGKVCSDKFFQKERLRTAGSRRAKQTPVEFYKAKHDLVHRHAEINGGTLFHAWVFLSRAPAHFPPLLAARLYRRFGATAVADPFAGWGDRALGAMALGIPYLGVDSNRRLRSCFRSMCDALPGGERVTVLFQKSQTVDFDQYDFDLVLSSPPYYGKTNHRLVERYNGAEANYHKFMDECLFPITQRFLDRGVRVLYALPHHMHIDLESRIKCCQGVIENAGQTVYIYQRIAYDDLRETV